MKYRKFVATTLKVSKIAMGSMHFKWIITEKEAFKILDYFFDQGGNFLDTSDMYAQWVEGFKGGEAEIIIGKWLKKRQNRDKIVLSTKVRARMWEGTDGEGLTKKHIFKACEESLKRLQTDYIDLYLSHWPDSETPIEETTLAYQKLVKQGKIRFFGCSNYSSSELKGALLAGEKIGTQYSSVQSYYNLLQRFPFEKETLPLIKKYNLAFTPYSPLAGGFLSERHNLQHVRTKFFKEKMTPANNQLLKLLKEIAPRYQSTVSQICFAWLLKQDWISAVITGAETITQLNEVLSSVAINLTEEDFNLIKINTTNP